MSDGHFSWPDVALAAVVGVEMLAGIAVGALIVLWRRK